MGRRHKEYKVARRTAERFRRRLRNCMDGKRIRYECSRHVMFFMSVYGFIHCMNERELRRRFCRAARDVLRLDEPAPEYVEKTRRKNRDKKRKKRKLMPQDYAWLLRSEGRKYETVPAACVAKANIHKQTGYERRDRAREEALDFWEAVTEQRERQKINARARHLRMKLGLATRHEVEKAKRRSVRSVSLRISRPLYEAIVHGECVSFNWREIPGHERDFMPDSYGRKVEVVSVRTPGMDPNYGWISFGVTELERFYRDDVNGAGGWFWRIGVGDIVDRPAYDEFE